jgi:uncharacterized protein
MYQARESVLTDDIENIDVKNPAEIFIIPHKDNYIIFAPLKQIAFIGNKQMVNMIAREQTENNSTGNKPAKEFVDKLGLLLPDALPEEDLSDFSYEPITVVLMMGNKCNLRCVYCYANSGERASEKMTWEIARIGIDIVAKNAQTRGLDSFELSFHGGGEPTANWQVLKKSVEYARKKPIRSIVSMASNGIMSRAKRRFVAENFDGISLSFDGLPHIQNMQRPTINGKPSFPILEKTIKAFDHSGLAYGIRMTVMPKHINLLVKMVEFVCENTGAGHIQVEPVFPEGRGKNEVWTDKALSIFAEQYPEALSIAQKNSREFFYSGATPDSITNRFCTAAVDALVLLPSGDISSCFEIHSRRHSKADDYIFGKIVKDKVLISKDKWKSVIARTGNSIEYCQDCFCLYSCAGDCMSKTFSGSSPDLFSPSWRCQINRELSKQKLLHNIALGKGLWLGQKEKGGCHE